MFTNDLIENNWKNDNLIDRIKIRIKKYMKVLRNQFSLFVFFKALKVDAAAEIGVMRTRLSVLFSVFYQKTFIKFFFTKRSNAAGNGLN